MQSIIESMLVPYRVLLWKMHVEVGYSHIQELIDFPIKSSLYSNYMGRTPIKQLLCKVRNLEFLGQKIKMWTYYNTENYELITTTKSEW